MDSLTVVLGLLIVIIAEVILNKYSAQVISTVKDWISLKDSGSDDPLVMIQNRMPK